VKVVLSFYFICCVCYFYIYLKLTGYDLIFKFFFFKVQVNINLGSNVFYFSIWALFIVIEKKKTKKAQKKVQKKSNFEKAVNGRLPISLTANRLINR
jgi:hypothetical protein